MFAGKLSELVLKKHKANGILEELYFGIELEAAFAQELLHTANSFLVEAQLCQNLLGFAGMKLGQGPTPLFVALAVGGISVTRDGPTP